MLSLSLSPADTFLEESGAPTCTTLWSPWQGESASSVFLQFLQDAHIIKVRSNNWHKFQYILLGSTSCLGALACICSSQNYVNLPFWFAWPADFKLQYRKQRQYPYRDLVAASQWHNDKLPSLLMCIYISASGSTLLIGLWLLHNNQYFSSVYFGSPHTGSSPL